MPLDRADSGGARWCVVSQLFRLGAQEHIEGTQKVFGTEARVILKLREESRVPVPVCRNMDSTA